MSTKITWITEPLYPNYYPEIIDNIRACLKELSEEGIRFYWYEHNAEGYVWWTGLFKNTAPDFKEWEHMNENITLPTNKGATRKLRMRWIADDDVFGDEDNL